MRQTGPMETLRKHRRGAPPGFFRVEAAGLAWLADAGAVRVARVLAVDDDSIELERLPHAPATLQAAEALSREIAEPGGDARAIHLDLGNPECLESTCQAIADACARRVLAGPVEATAIGNIMMQAIATGHLANLEDGRKMVRASFPVKSFEPRNTTPWKEAFTRCSSLFS